jgi:threonylcarbamoyladenosine tRNA methylthiotransferase MtaB
MTSKKSAAKLVCPKFSITTLGCKVNRCESDAIARQLSDHGLIPSAESGDAYPGKAHFCIINTCTVTHKASVQSRQAIRRAIKKNPHARIIVTGCYAQIKPDEIRKIAKTAQIVDHAHKDKIYEWVASVLTRAPQVAPDAKTGPLKQEAPQPQSRPCIPDGNGRSRPFLKIQDGCNNFCAYCIIPHARGSSQSLPMDAVMHRLAELSAAGFREIVLAGINLGRYGMDLKPATGLIDLLEKIRRRRPAYRVRLSSIEPCELTPPIIRIVADSGVFCRHFHIPLQSGDDTILARMHRPYTGEMFAALVQDIHRLIPDAAIGVDALVGFPGESEAAFQNTYQLINTLPITYLHVFPFSKRPHTLAEKLDDQVPPNIIKHRCSKLRALGRKKKENFLKRNIGKNVDVLLESSRIKSTGLLKGITSNYIVVHTDGSDLLKNCMVRIKITDLIGDNAVFGRISTYQPSHADS